jgi:hypothetical protein
LVIIQFHSELASSSLSFPQPSSSSSDLEEESKTLDGEIGGFTTLHQGFHSPTIPFSTGNGSKFAFFPVVA